MAYGGQLLSKGTPELTVVEPIPEGGGRVLATARAGETEAPYALRARRFWFFADLPFAFATETDRYLVLCDLRPLEVTGDVAETALDEAGITVNKNLIPYDPVTPKVTSGIRLGTPALTSRGMGPDEMVQIGQMIASQQAGAISVLQYADRIYQLPLGVVGIAVGVVLLPELAR